MDSQIQSIHQRTIIITGANKGIGFAIVQKLLESANSYNIIVTSRDPKLGEEAVKKLASTQTQTGSTLTYHQLDVNDDKSIQGLIDWLNKEKLQIDVLVNNAGVMFHNANLEQRQKTIQTNYTSVIHLTERLIPLLTEDAKIINISSILGSFSCISPSFKKELEKPNITEKDLQQLVANIEDYYKDFQGSFDGSYCTSKALLNAYTRWVLTQKLKPTQQCYSLAPGWCQTELGGPQAPLPVEAGADTPVHLIELPFKNHPELNGMFLEQRQVIPF